MKQSREWLAGALLAACGGIFALAMLEAGVRWLHLLPDRFWQPDEILGSRLIPGKSGWWTQEEREFLVPIQINQKGQRDVEHDEQKAVGAVRVLVLGDSFVEAMQVPLQDTFTRRLEEKLNATGKYHTEVINAGVSGYGTAGAVLFFEREGKRYRPDVVILAFYVGNDIRNNSAELEDTLRPVYDARSTLERVVSVDSRGGTSGGGWLAHSSAYRYLRQLVILRQPALSKLLMDLNLLRREAVHDAPDSDEVPVAYGVYAEPLAPEWLRAWESTEGLLRRLRDDVQGAGARLVVAIVPARELIYPDTWEEILATHPRMRQGAWDLEAPERRLRAWCSAAGVPLVDLVPAFREAKEDSGELLHYRYDGHWTAAGHQIAASALAGFIEHQNWIPSEQEEARK